MALVTVRTTRTRWVPLAKTMTPPIIWKQLYKRLIVRSIPDAERYDPHYSPWLEPDFLALYERIRHGTVVPLQSCHTLWQVLGQTLHLDGDVMEAGVFQGGTARLLRERMGNEASGKRLMLFDSFEGMKKVSGQDRHRENDFADTSVEGVSALVGKELFIEYHKGWIPDTFAGLEDRRFCFAHIDLDLYQGILDSLNFLYPRMISGGGIVFDDYGFASCPGARAAVDEFFADKPEQPLILSTAQAVVFKL